MLDGDIVVCSSKRGLIKGLTTDAIIATLQEWLISLYPYST